MGCRLYLNRPTHTLGPKARNNGHGACFPCSPNRRSVLGSHSPPLDVPWVPTVPATRPARRARLAPLAAALMATLGVEAGGALAGGAGVDEARRDDGVELGQLELELVSRLARAARGTRQHALSCGTMRLADGGGCGVCVGAALV